VRKNNATVILLCFFVFIAIIFSGCTNAMDLHILELDGKGSVYVSFSAGKSALLPSLLDFDVYEFIFTNTVNGAEKRITKTKNEPFVFIMELGEKHTLAVNSYKGSVHDDNLGASGTSSQFTVNKVTNVPVKLSGYKTEGVEGYFSYEIKLPDGAVADKLELYLDENTSYVLPANIIDGVIAGSESVPAGKYFLMVWLSMGNKEAVDQKLVIIRSNAVTCYGTDADPVIFTEANFKAREEPDDPGENIEQVSRWHGFDVAGNSNYFINDATKPGHNGGNYDPGRATGTRYAVFTDPNGQTWNDVLMLSPPVSHNTDEYRDYEPGIPQGSYQNWTMIMTYPIQKAGKYYVSMSIWIDKPSNVTTTFYWQNTGGLGEDDTPGAWACYIPISQSGSEWHNVSFDLTLADNEEIGILARSLDDTSLYIREIKVLDDTGNEPSTNLVLNVDSFTLVQGGNHTITASKPALWSVAPAGVVTVIGSIDGYSALVTATGIGNATITAVSKEDSAETATANVNVVAEGTRFIALSLDDGPHPEMTPLFLDVLKRYGAFATFFCIGQSIEANVPLAKIIDEAGHEIGNHSYYHNYTGLGALCMQSVSSIHDELQQTQYAINNAIGKTPKIFRAPALLYSRGSDDEYAEKQYGENNEEACRQLGLALIDTEGHQAGNFDWDGRSPEAVFNTVKSLARDWGIILLHDSQPNTLTALPRILEWLNGEGYTVLTVSQLAEKRKNAAGLAPAANLEPGRIYYNLAEIPEHVGSITFNQGGTAVPPEGITLSNDVRFLDLTAVISPAAVSGQPLYWYSDNQSIVTVNNGRVTAVNVGSTTRNTTIRAVAGGQRAIVNVTVLGTSPGTGTEPFETITSWVHENGFIIPGVGGNDLEGAQYFPSNARGTVSSYYGFDNVLRLTPDESGLYYWKPEVGGGMALCLEAPYTGIYTLSMDVWVDSSRTDVNMVWHECDNWSEIRADVNTLRSWFTYSGTLADRFRGNIPAGTVTGLLAHSWWDGGDGSNGNGLRHSTIYIKNLKMEVKTEDGNDIVIMSINSPVTSTGPVGSKYIALTFDDGPAEGFTGQLLDILDANNAKATFYIQGSKVGTYAWDNNNDCNVYTAYSNAASLLQRMYSTGHEIGNHSWSHRIGYKDDGDIYSTYDENTGFWGLYAQIVHTDAIIGAALGVNGWNPSITGRLSPYYNAKTYRPPEGALHGNLEKRFMEAWIEFYSSDPYKSFAKPIAGWTSDSEDWTSANEDAIYNNITRGTGNRIILLHDTSQKTVNATGRAITTLKAEGYEFVTLAEYLRREGVTPLPGQIIGDLE